MSDMKFLFINPGESRHGSTYRARGLCRLLRNCGHQVTYAESNYGDGNDFISIRQRDSLLGYVTATAKRCALCFTSDYAILYLQKAWPLTLGCMIIAKLRKKKVFIDFDDLDSEWQTRPLRRKLMQLTERWMPKHADLVTTHNRYLQRFIGGIMGRLPLIIPQGIDTELFDPQKYDRQLGKKRLGLENHRVLCFLGSFTIGSSKDLSVIFEAIRQVQERQGGICLLIIGGEGPLEGQYFELINTLRLRNVRITGRIPHHHVPHYLAACDVGLIFMEENRVNRMRVSLKLIEYLSMDLPVVGHITGESRDVFGRYCFLCPPSPRSLGEKILEVLENQHQRKSPRDFIVQHYDWKAIGRSVNELLRNWVA
jgi:glycosyltransferase involved in cell wall biosynthesis